MMDSSVDQLSSEAMQAHRAGDFTTAESLCRKGLELDPNNAKILVHLSVLLRNRGLFEPAMGYARKAIEHLPNLADGYIQLGLSQLGVGDFWSAELTLAQAASLSPAVSAIHYNRGLALENLGRIGEALACFEKACRINPQDVRARLSLGSLMLSQENLTTAKDHADYAIRLDPTSAPAQLLQAKISVAQGKGFEAESSMRRAIELDPNLSFAHTMLGFRQLQTGDFVGAEASFLRSLELDSEQGVAYFGITQARKLTTDDSDLLSKMSSLCEGESLASEQRAYLHFAIANAKDSLKEYGSAMLHYDEAHRNASRSRGSEGTFNAEEYQAKFKLTQELYPQELLQDPGEHFDSNLPIFIVGMIRSGTTLTEQILSSHPEVGAAGEDLFWPHRAHLAEDFDRMKVDRKQATRLAREYCRELRKVAPRMSRVTDKLPGNYMRLGLLHMALPNAKIIHCRRSPVDTALSIYFTANPTAQAFSHSKEGIVFAYRQYLELMEHWRGLLPSDRLYEVEYEALIENPEKEIRAMLEFLGLDWSDSCLRHDQNAKDVRTPSLWQVRQPIYKSSVERWRNYEPWLGAFSELIR